MTFTDLLRNLGIPYREAGQHHHCTYGWVNLDCPRCSPRMSRWRMGYNVRGGYCSCWSCGSVPVAEVLAQATGKRFHEVQTLLEGVQRGSDIPEPKPRGKLVIPAGVGPLQEPHRRYLQARGFDPQHLEAFWGVRGIGIAARLGWRLWIPVTQDGETVSWTTRAISDNVQVRYINARPQEESVSAKSVLFGEEHCRNAVVVCEGPFDAMRIGPGAVATMGTAISQAQVLRLMDYTTRVICFDNEEDAQRRARKLADQLGVLRGETWNVVLEVKDPGEMQDEEVQELRKQFLD